MNEEQLTFAFMDWMRSCYISFVVLDRQAY